LIKGAGKERERGAEWKTEGLSGSGRCDLSFEGLSQQHSSWHLFVVYVLLDDQSFLVVPSARVIGQFDGSG
jgi:hypothetical protein